MESCIHTTDEESLKQVKNQSKLFLSFVFAYKWNFIWLYVAWKKIINIEMQFLFQLNVSTPLIYNEKTTGYQHKILVHTQQRSSQYTSEIRTRPTLNINFIVNYDNTEIYNFLSFNFFFWRQFWWIDGKKENKHFMTRDPLRTQAKKAGRILWTFPIFAQI